MTAAVPDLLSLEPTRPLRRWEYDRLVEAGAFEDEKLELIEGRLVVMSPEGSPHAATVSRLTERLVLALAGRAMIRTGHPLAVSDASQPEPDLAVVPIADYDHEHPAKAFLVIEVSHSSIRKDRFIKPRLYASAGIPEYWIVDLTTGTVTVLRTPENGTYTSTESRAAGQVIALAAFPDSTIVLDDVLPRRRSS